MNLDEMLEDFRIFKLKHYMWISDEEVWRKWLRSN